MGETFDPTKPCTTRNGRPARIVCTDRKLHGGPIVALYIDESGGEQIASYTPDGNLWCRNDRRYDLINIPEKIEGWVNFYDSGEGSFRGYSYPSRADADRTAKDERIACIKISFTEGEGLDHAE